MSKILVFNGNQPCLDVQGNDTGVNRDRNPDAGWDELCATNMKFAKEVELTSELKVILIEDLAYFLGKHSDKFTAKLKEFNLLTIPKDDDVKLKQLVELLEKSNVRQYTCMNDFGYSQLERDIVNLFK